MKIKQDFVTNSSSTSFMFIFNGNKRTNLFEKMVKYGDKFHLYNEYGPGGGFIEVWDIIKCIDPILSSNKEDPWYLPGPVKTETLIKSLKEDLVRYKKDLKVILKKEEEEGSSYYKSSDWTKEYIQDCELKIRKIEEAIKNNLDHYVEISFGDNDGMIQGGRIGTTMDYNGRSININQKDFMVYVTNCH